MKTPYLVEGGDVLALAGVYDGRGFVIVTREAAKGMRWLHGRMPVVLEGEAREAWIGAGGTEDALKVLDGGAKEMECCRMKKDLSGRAVKVGRVGDYFGKGEDGAGENGIGAGAAARGGKEGEGKKREGKLGDGRVAKKGKKGDQKTIADFFGSRS